MTSVLQHASEIIVPPEGTRYMFIEIIQDTTYTLKFTIHAPSNRGHCCEKYIRDIPYIPSPMLELIKLIQFQPCDPMGDKVYQTLSTMFNSTLHQTMQKEYETVRIDAITITKDKLEIENKTLQHELQTLQNENVKLKHHVEEQTHKLTCTHYELLVSTGSVARLEKELTTAQSIIKNLSRDLDDTTTELKIWESRCMQYEDELYDLQQEKDNSSLDTILESAIAEL
jgi:hypothetical protein